MRTEHAGKRGCITFYFLLVFAFPSLLPVALPNAAAGPALHGARVLAVNDGDTVTLRFDWQDHRTRLIGIDAPELGQTWGREAKDHLRELMNHAEWYVYVETDETRRDKYGRLLAYLWTRENVLINEQMISDGYAVLFTIAPNVKYAERLGRAERTARNAKKAIWGPDGLKETPSEYRKRHPSW